MRPFLLAAWTAIFVWGVGARCEAQIAGASYVTNAGVSTFATAAPGDPDRLYLAGRGGRISILDLTTSEVLDTPFLEIDDIDSAGEGGLLGLAFHPDYQTNGRFYVYATVDNGGVTIDGESSPFSSHIREYTRSALNADLADAASEREVLSWAQPRNNHNGGWIGFDPTAAGAEAPYLYISSGDGGKQRDPDNNAQTLTGDLLGKILRIDVDGDDFPTDAGLNYAIPDNNPFVGVAGDDEIWSYGLRNPWRASFDRETGDFWIADVGQGAREEINHQLADSPGGENYAWNRREGFASHQGGELRDGDVEPVYDYLHGSGEFRGNSVTGGYVYRGDDAALAGDYFFADFSTSNYWKFDPADPIGTVENINDQLFGSGRVAGNPIAFAEDAAGDLYILTIGGDIWRIETTAPGDYNGDGIVDNLDFNVWAAGYGGADLAADGNNDGRVDAADYVVWRVGSEGAQRASAAPEPSSLLLVALAGLPSITRRRLPDA